MTLNLPNIWISVGNAVFLLAVYLYLRKNISTEHILGSSLLAMFTALISGRLFYAFLNQTSYVTAVNIFKSHAGGHSVLGAIIGAFFVFFIEILTFYKASISAFAFLVNPSKTKT